MKQLNKDGKSFDGKIGIPYGGKLWQWKTFGEFTTISY